MSAVAFDTLSIARNLKEAGFEEKQAEALATMFGESRCSTLENVVTKTDLKAANAEVRTEIAEVRTDLAQLETKMFRAFWLLGAGIITLMIGLIRLAFWI